LKTWAEISLFKDRFENLGRILHPWGTIFQVGAKFCIFGARFKNLGKKLVFLGHRFENLAKN
jgi:hypothetical protein